MKLVILSGLILLPLLGFINASQTEISPESQPVVVPQISVTNVLDDSGVTALAYGVFDTNTQELLFSKNPNFELPIASITKLFTAATVFSQIQNDRTVIITAKDIETEGRAGKLEEDQEYQVKELIFPLLLESSNDAATALERIVKKIPFSGRNLADASGLSSQNKATVFELSKEVGNLYRTSPHIFDITTLKQYIGESTGWINNSPVRDLSGYRGGKHGFTVEASHTLVAIFAEPSLDDRELGYVILGSDDVRSDVKKLRSIVGRSVSLE